MTGPDDMTPKTRLQSYLDAIIYGMGGTEDIQSKPRPLLRLLTDLEQLAFEIERPAADPEIMKPIPPADGENYNVMTSFPPNKPGYFRPPSTPLFVLGEPTTYASLSAAFTAIEARKPSKGGYATLTFKDKKVKLGLGDLNLIRPVGLDCILAAPLSSEFEQRMIPALCTRLLAEGVIVQVENGYKISDDARAAQVTVRYFS